MIMQTQSWVSISTYGELQNCELQLSSHQHPQDEGHTLTDAATQHHSLGEKSKSGVYSLQCSTEETW
ncbi:hypothetical protein AALO_G00079970 [Alosa alosa]|uniref:Uncharacterized protein n=1 Tax=Alosa alosa TaxID=278164 RepID=A0AAV6GZ25_9TELE|nr:hypothetical protein AALO_G00079970 [Alosa alosa]